MKQLPNYNLYIFKGSEAHQSIFKTEIVDNELYYVGYKEGGDIVSGPYQNERSALNDAYAMTDTSGT